MNTLRKYEILRGRKNFQEIFKTNVKFEGNFIQCFILVKSLETEPLAKVLVSFCVSRNISKAVDRNRIKRLLREAYRRNKNNFLAKLKLPAQQMWLLFLYSPKTLLNRKLPKYFEVETDVKMLLEKIAQTSF